VFFSNVHNLILLQDLNAKLEKLMAENKELNAKLENLKDENRELLQKNNGNKK
jgi:cell division protein FtsB